jgi:hypothetical protein
VNYRIFGQTPIKPYPSNLLILRKIVAALAEGKEKARVPERLAQMTFALAGSGD